MTMFAFGWLWGVAGILLIMFGGYMLLFFPFTTEHQTEEFALSGPLIGLVCLIIGGILVLL